MWPSNLLPPDLKLRQQFTKVHGTRSGEFTFSSWMTKHGKQAKVAKTQCLQGLQSNKLCHCNRFGWEHVMQSWCWGWQKPRHWPQGPSDPMMLLMWNCISIASKLRWTTRVNPTIIPIREELLSFPMTLNNLLRIITTQRRVSTPLHLSSSHRSLLVYHEQLRLSTDRSLQSPMFTNLSSAQSHEITVLYCSSRADLSHN